MTNDPETVVKSQRIVLNSPTAPPPPPGSSLLQLLFSAGSKAPVESKLAKFELGGFQIEQLVGKGGMASVFRAKDTNLDRTVALKVMDPNQFSDPAAILRFENEARAAARLDHPNIIRVHHSGEDRGLHFIALEYVAGTNLRELVNQQGKMAPSVAVNYALQIANALNHSSGRGVIHRDVKPSNIIISPNGRAKLVDMGLARCEDPDGSGDLTVDGTTLGTFDYIAPEQAKDPRNVDIRTDLYGLGCTLYFMLTGEPPYPDGTVLQKLLDHQASEIPDPAAKNRHVSEGLTTIVRKLMAPNPVDRYPSAEHAIRDLMLMAGSFGLRGINADGLIWTTPTQSPPRFVERHLGWMTAAAALVLMVVLINRFPNIGASAPDEVAEKSAIGQHPTGGPANLPLKTVEQKSVAAKSAPGPSIAAKSGTPQPNNAETGSSTPPVHEPTDRIVAALHSVVPGGLPSLAPDASLLQFNTVVQPSPEVVVSGPPSIKPAVAEPIVSNIRLISSESRDQLDFQSIESAMLAATSGDIIELRFNGIRPAGKPEQPWRIANKNVAIRAAQGFRPTIQFTVDKTTVGSDGLPRMISLLKSRIDLVNIDIEMIIPDGVPSEGGWTLLSLSPADHVRLKGVTISVTSPNQTPVSILRVDRARGSLAEMPLDPAAPGIVIDIDSSCVRGRCSLVTIPHDQPGRIEIKNCAFVLDGLIENGAILNVNPGRKMAPEGKELTIKLVHSTFVVNNGFMQVQNAEAMAGTLAKSLLPIKVSARDNIFSTESNEPLIRMSGSLEADDFKWLLSWNGAMNYYESFQVFWRINTTMNLDDSRDVSFESWKELWQQSELGADNGALLQQILWKSDWRLAKSLQDVNVSDLVLDDRTTEPNSALTGATDGSNVGAVIELLPSFPRAVDVASERGPAN
ncbi:MAG: serine/threonine-protein kinase [Planctomycetota bacterium]|nr:serine/threonine-protein kinase [Planctomycetota bacterium]